MQKTHENCFRSINMEVFFVKYPNLEYEFIRKSIKDKYHKNTKIQKYKTFNKNKIPSPERLSKFSMYYPRFLQV